MNIDTVQFSHILETSDLPNLHSFLARTVFVISHKNEKVKTLRQVLWYLPLNSPIIIVTNCQASEKEELRNELKLELTEKGFSPAQAAADSAQAVRRLQALALASLNC